MEGIYSPNSPFARKVRVVAIETGQADAVAWTSVDLGRPAPALAAVNPLGQVPVLATDEGGALYDSAVICAYLDARHDGPKLIPPGGQARWEALRLQALGDGLGAASAALAGERRRPEDRRFAPFIDNQSGKIARALARLEADLAALEAGLTIAPIAAGWRRWRTGTTGFRNARRCAGPRPRRPRGGRRGLVGVSGFEPPAPASRRQCSTRLSYTPHPGGPLL